MLLQTLLAALAVITVLATSAVSMSALARPAAATVASGGKGYARQSDCRLVVVIRSDGSRVRVMRCN
jgi:hypothetical protein